MSLRAALQQIEKTGMIDYTVGGHKCERPGEVVQGHADDRFQISPDPDQALLYRSNAVAAKNLKFNNLASFFTFQALEASPLVLAPWLDCSVRRRSQVWRLRIYGTEKCVAAAKSLWHLATSLQFEKDECKRVV